MNKRKKWVVGLSVGAGVLVLVVGAGCLIASHWLPTDAELAQRLAALAEERLGVKVSIGSSHWALLPTPAVTVDDFRTLQPQPVVVRSLRASLSVRKLLHGKIQFERIDINGATLPRNSVHAWHGSPTSTQAHAASDDVQLEHLEFRDLTWITLTGIATIYDGEIDFDPHWRPRQAALRRPGFKPHFELTLAREPEADHWQVQFLVGGGTAHGDVALKTDGDGTLHLSGKLAPRDIEVASAMGAIDRVSPISGKGSGQTNVSAQGKSPGALTASLHTHTRFSIPSATALHFDLDKAIHSAGKEHDGQTALQDLTGELDTQNGEGPIRITLSNIHMHADKFTASGQAVLFDGQVQASGNLDLVDGAVGVPFTVSGPIKKPKLSVPPGFFAGAAVGTAVLPGVGTVIGARLGGALGKLFKGGKDDTQAPAPPSKE